MGRKLTFVGLVTSAIDRHRNPAPYIRFEGELYRWHGSSYESVENPGWDILQELADRGYSFNDLRWFNLFEEVPMVSLKKEERKLLENVVSLYKNEDVYIGKFKYGNRPYELEIYRNKDMNKAAENPDIPESEYAAAIIEIPEDSFSAMEPGVKYSVEELDLFSFEEDGVLKPAKNYV